MNQQVLIDMEPSEHARKKRALEELRVRSEALAAAKSSYEEALWHARDLGIANTVIARRVGLSEAAVRMFFKRSEGKRK